MTDHPSDFDTLDSPQSPDWEALARHIASEDTTESTTRIDALLSEPSERDLVASLKGVTDRLSAGIPADLDVEAALRSVKTRMRQGDRPSLKVESGRSVRQPAPVTKWRVPFRAIAAAGLVVVGLGTWLAVGKRTET